jgi:hypothetical protein
MTYCQDEHSLFGKCTMQVPSLYYMESARAAAIVAADCYMDMQVTVRRGEETAGSG